jgi:phenylalanyl-tRNA synthetase beta chain
MKFSEKWLREWVDPPVDSDALAEQLTTAGLEVDSVEPVAPPFTGIVVGEVLSVEPHPNADKLRVCRVDVGGNGPLSIVCGAPNVHTGMRAPTALIGTELPGGMKIKPARLRGVDSSGMLCSAKELGLEETSPGLMPLPGDAPVGSQVWDYLGLDDVSIDVDLTPNRGDCLGIAGIARDVAVVNRLPVGGPSMDPVRQVIDETFPVQVAAPADCPRYVGRVIRNVDPGAPTPLWMREKLRRSGLRSISAIVDVTNYVLLELGQPMHAFDLDRLQGRIRVRRAQPGEPITLLDASESNLEGDTLVIADDAGAKALAGIMGGLDSAVSDTTRHLFLESAFFTPEAIAGRARRYGLSTDSSHRFERGVDFELQRRAAERATALLLEIVGGEPGPIIDAVSPDHLPRREAVPLRPARVRRLLGVGMSPETVQDIMERLGMGLEPDGDGWRVTPPSWRFDIALEADLIEELARVIGYDQVPSVAPIAHLRVGPEPESRVELPRMRSLLIARDYQEALTYSFVDPELQARVDPDQRPIPLSNPISADLAVMRTSLWPGLIKALAHNQNRQQARVRLFETGLRFVREGAQTLQTPSIAGAAAGGAYPEQWGAPQRPMDFFDLKADVEALLGLGGSLEEYRFTPARHPALHPGQAAAVQRGDTPAGLMGALHPALIDPLGLTGPVYLFELRLPVIQASALPRFEPLSKFPTIRRDIAIIVDEGVTAQSVRECIGQAAPNVLKNLRFFDVYRGEGIDSGKKSLALGLILQAASRTLTDEEVDGLIGRVVESLKQELAATLRG